MITFTVPLPPPPLRSNSRCHWRTKVAAKQAYSRAVYGWYVSQVTEHGYASLTPLSEARITYLWRYCGVAPDRQNLGANLKALTDILCMAPKTTQPNGTYYLGLVEDDKGIEPVYELEKVQRRAAEELLITIIPIEQRETDEHEHCYAEFHRCDGGGPGEAAKYTDNQAR